MWLLSILTEKGGCSRFQFWRMLCFNLYMKIFINYLGQIRLYSLTDLVLLLVVVGTGYHQLFGAVVLHLAFLAYLEHRHAHPYRAKVPVVVVCVLALTGLVYFGKIEGLFYLFFSYLYTRKTKERAFLSPVFRGLQYFFIVAGIIGYSSLIPYFVAIVITIRNLVGDLRDTEKDRKEGVRTIPVVLGVKRSIKHIHLVAMIITSVLWWLIATNPVSYLWLLVVICIEVSTYYLT